MKPYFIVNPIAGGGSALTKFERLKQLLEKMRIEFGCSFSERAGESTSLAERAYSEGERYIIAVGGDGTVNEVASALIGKEDAVMGICPFGTGNDFARALELSGDPEAAAETIKNGVVEPVDAGLAGSKAFINAGGVGFDVDVVINTEKYKKRFRGMLPYLLGIMKSVTHLKSFPVKLTADGEEIKEDALIVAVANGSHFGGGMNVAPGADPKDGYFNVCLVKKIGFFRFMQLMPKFIKGKHVGCREVKYFTAKEIDLDCGERPMQLDGELGAKAPARFRMLHGALKMKLPVRA
jgi:YegS/Rv2252/BmrU family lipid kinase